MAKGRRKIVRVRTIKPNASTYIHVGVTSRAGPRGGHTISGPVRHKKKKRKN